MSTHKFGIMEFAPVSGERYDDYEPWKYSCISVDDNFIEPFLSAFSAMDFFWHSVDISGKGLAYCGVTLIPPESMEEIIRIIKNAPELCRLKKLMSEAVVKHKYVIHFGI